MAPASVPRDETPEQQRERYRRRRMAQAQEDAAAALALPENRWARDLLDLYLDVKDHAPGTRLSDLSPAARRAFRIIRQATGGTLGGPPSAF